MEIGLSRTDSPSMESVAEDRAGAAIWGEFLGSRGSDLGRGRGDCGREESGARRVGRGKGVEAAEQSASLGAMMAAAGRRIAGISRPRSGRRPHGCGAGRLRVAEHGSVDAYTANI